MAPGLRIPLGKEGQKGGGNMMRNLLTKKIMGGVTLTVVSLIGLLVLAAPASATDIEHMVCVTPTCSSGTTTLLVGSSTPKFGMINVNGAVTGTVFVGVLEPNVTSGGAPVISNLTFEESKFGFNSSPPNPNPNTLGLFLVEPGLTDMNFSA